MDRDQVATILAEIGTLLELQGETGFRTNAYHNGARAIQQLEEDLGEVIRRGKLGDVPGIGATLTALRNVWLSDPHGIGSNSSRFSGC